MENAATPKGSDAGQRSEGRRAESSLWAPWIAVVVALLTLGGNVYLNFNDRREARHVRLLEHRREALLAALTVIDHVYSNEPIGPEGKKPNPHEWDIQLARDAMNRMRVYCNDPRTVTAFTRALGLYNPAKEKPRGISLEALDDFRRQVARELELPDPGSGDPNLVWISTLSGGR